MFNIGFSEMLVIAILALIFIGPKQLPEVARTIGRFLNELRRSSDAIKEEFVKSSKELIDDAKPKSENQMHPDQVQSNFENGHHDGNHTAHQETPDLPHGNKTNNDDHGGSHT